MPGLKLNHVSKSGHWWWFLIGNSCYLYAKWCVDQVRQLNYSKCFRVELTDWSLISAGVLSDFVCIFKTNALIQMIWPQFRPWVHVTNGLKTWYHHHDQVDVSCDGSERGVFFKFCQYQCSCILVVLVDWVFTKYDFWMLSEVLIFGCCCCCYGLITRCCCQLLSGLFF